jgi:hypothetical protein
MRRGFYQFHASTKSPIAAELLAQVASLYAIEAEIRGTPDAATAPGDHNALPDKIKHLGVLKLSRICKLKVGSVGRLGEAGHDGRECLAAEQVARGALRRDRFPPLDEDKPISCVDILP